MVEGDDANKVAIFDAGGVSALAGRLKAAPDPQERALVAAVLWNLSACEEIKPHLLEVAVAVVVKCLISWRWLLLLLL